MDKKNIAFYVKKHIASQAVCYNFPLVRDKLIGSPAFVSLVGSLHSHAPVAPFTNMV